jgi:hypothetical protein
MASMVSFTLDENGTERDNGWPFCLWDKKSFRLPWKRKLQGKLVIMVRSKGLYEKR